MNSFERCHLPNCLEMSSNSLANVGGGSMRKSLLTSLLMSAHLLPIGLASRGGKVLGGTILGNSLSTCKVVSCDGKELLCCCKDARGDWTMSSSVMVMGSCSFFI